MTGQVAHSKAEIPHPTVGTIPSTVLNQIGSELLPSRDGRTFTKKDPATGRALCEVARSGAGESGRE